MNNLINWLRKFSYRCVLHKVVSMHWEDEDTTSRGSVVFLQNGFGKRKVVCHQGDLYPTSVEKHPYYHAVVIPWLSGFPVNEEALQPKPKTPTLTVINGGNHG